MAGVGGGASTRFSLHVWPEAVSGGAIEWRGKIHHLASGDARYFRDWPTMLAFLEAAAAGSPPPVEVTLPERTDSVP